MDELERVMGENACLRSPGPGHRWDEYDVLRSCSRRTVRRLIGAGYLRAHGLEHDVASDMIERAVPGVLGGSDAVAWFLRTALVAIGESRSIAHARIYARRSRRARAAGYRSFHHYRTTRDARP